MGIELLVNVNVQPTWPGCNCRIWRAAQRHAFRFTSLNEKDNFGFPTQYFVSFQDIKKGYVECFMHCLL
jgi:hypothetical protein